MSKFPITPILFSLTVLTLAVPRLAHADINSWQKGLTLRLTNENTSDVDASLRTLAETGANYVTITPGWLTDNEKSSNVYRKARTPSDEILIYTIKKAHTMGLKVMLKPHIDISNGNWRAFIDPNDKATFFKNYGNMIMHYANIAKDNNVAMFSVGCELYKLTTNQANEHYWRDLIAQVRSVYKGGLTYSATASSSYYDETILPFWDALDYVGVDIYRKLADDKNPPISEMLANWQKVENDFVLPLKNRVKKPILITELGYRSIDGAAMEPENYTQDASVDLQEQADLYKAMLEFWKDKDYMVGIHIWDWKPWENAGGSTDKDYTAQNKPAEDVLTSYWKGSSTPSEPTEPTQPQPTQSTLTVGSTFFTDRDYTIKALPKYLEGLELLKTKNDDKYSTNSNYLSFDLAQDATVYVLFDGRATSLPKWLDGWTKQPAQVATTDTTFNVYEKTFGASSVTLGGNAVSPMSGAQSNYFVAIAKGTTSAPVESLISDLTVKGAKATAQTVAKGSKLYTDRDYTITLLPSELVAGSHVQTANDDKYSTSSNYVQFALGSAANVYVVFDNRATSLPHWLSSWEKTSNVIDTSDVKFTVYKKSFNAGDVVLGGNGVSPMNGAQSNYFVIVK